MSTNPTDNDLIIAALDGDFRAFDVLVERYQEYLFRLMVRACHHPDDAEDVAIEAFARAYEKLGQFEGRSSFVSWIGRIATNLCFRTREKMQVDSVSDSHTVLHKISDHVMTNDPERELMQSEMRNILRRAVEKLPEPDQSVLRLRDIDELTAKQTAEKTGLTESAVKSRLHRARKALRAQLNQDFGINVKG